MLSSILGHFCSSALPAYADCVGNMRASTQQSTAEEYTVVEANDTESASQLTQDFELAEAIAATDLTLTEAGERDSGSLVCYGNGRDGKPLVRKKPQAKAKTPEVKKFYVIFHAPNHLECLGIFHGTWSRVLKDILPTGALCGSGCSVKGFACLEEAKEKWAKEGWESEAPYTVLP